MPSLKLGDATIAVSEARVSREAIRMFAMSPGRRQARVAASKERLARAVKAKAPERNLKKLAAILVSQGVTEA